MKINNILRDINDRLELPQSAKTRILMEINADIEDMYSHYKQQGIPTDEIEAIIVENFYFSEESLSRLVDIHTPPLRRFLDRVDCFLPGRNVQIFLSLIFFILSYAAVHNIFISSYEKYTSLMIYPILASAIVAVGLAGRKAYQLYFTRYDQKRGLRSGLNGLLLCGGLSLLFAFLGYFIELFRAGMQAILLAPVFYNLVIAIAARTSLAIIVEWTMRSSLLMLVGLLLTMMIALLWFFLNSKVMSIEMNKIKNLLES